MQKILLTILAALAVSPLQAQTGDGAISSRNAASDNQWQNWTFAGATLVTATTAVLILLTDNGSHAH
jgi:hypothetical protein